MDDLKIFLINLEKTRIKNKDSGEVIEFCKITYAIPVPDEERFSGLCILDSYKNVKYFDELKSYTGKPHNVQIRKIRQKSGFKYSLISIDGKELI